MEKALHFRITKKVLLFNKSALLFDVTDSCHKICVSLYIYMCVCMCVCVCVCVYDMYGDVET